MYFILHIKIFNAENYTDIYIQTYTGAYSAAGFNFQQTHEGT